ncbi:flagellin lysine-N-methylase [Lysinibacillus sp. fls2-241-R2A-57]|uniref:flagellin lysine-N-methylase n=1 Tax=Lysinibacillus sp. fls2-241-R2A-57 TaxID=3040292 RepID=UPI002555F4AB|nr:flagellin lysine-N-methylase [Lysinibacillus sp. fls2-241-R2A-57]
MRPILIPEYLSEFRCIGGACEDTCCVGWRVTVDKKTYQAYRRVRHPEMVEKLQKYVKRDRKQQNDSSYAKFILDENKKCSMILDDGLCSIQKELGEEFLCNTCAIYPRNLTKVGHVTEKSLTLSCPEAARIVLLREEGLGFIETEEPKDTRGLVINELNIEKHPHFWDLRIFTIQLMQSRQQPIEIRLIILGLFIQKIEQLKPSELERELPEIMQDYLNRLDNEKFIESLNNIQGNLNFQLTLARELIRYRMSDGSASKKYLTILQQLLEGLGLEEDKDNEGCGNMEEAISKYLTAYTNFYESFMQKQEYMIENYIVNYVFKNLFPYDYNTLFESYIMLVIHFALIKLHLIGMSAKQQQLTQEMVVECVQQFAKVIEHNPHYLKGVREGIDQSGFNSMGHMFVMIKS